MLSSRHFSSPPPLEFGALRLVPPDHPIQATGTSDAKVRAYMRVAPLGVAAGWVMEVAFLRRHGLFPREQFLYDSLFAIFFAIIGLMVVVGLWSQPEFLIPPGMRSEPGYLRRRLPDHTP